ncbi:MAG: phytanoyl-CoA dioxygenase family protein [Opitutales bacterium]|nr:phytanoyl-CoA dioxygenase family protein [Opitutales bacterium]
METITEASIRCAGVELDERPESFGRLRSSEDAVSDFGVLRDRLAGDGYLYMPGLLDAGVAREIRLNVLCRLKAEGHLDSRYRLEEGVLRPDTELFFRPDLVRDDPALRAFLFRGRLTEFFAALLEEAVLHFDFIWFRAMSRGKGTKPHCDFPYMGRGTFDLYTAWIPYGHVPLDVGGLMLLEGSHLKTPTICKRYLARDVDSYCTNKPWGQLKEDGWSFDGTLSSNARTLREKLGGRWLTAEYNPGDVLIFGMGMVHASLDNRTRRIRLSSDTRYQRASEPADERWVGPEPVGHGPGGKRGLIC